MPDEGQVQPFAHRGREDHTVRADARANHQAVLAAARRMFAQHGPDVPLTTIAEDANVGIGTLYRHFPDRPALIYAIAEEFCDEAIDVVDKCQQVWAADPLTAWTGFVRELARLRLSTLTTQLVVPAVLESLPAEAVRLRDQAIAALGTILVNAQAAGLVDHDVSPERFMIGLAAITRPLPQFPPAMLPDETDWLIATYLRGLRPSSRDDHRPRAGGTRG